MLLRFLEKCENAHNRYFRRNAVLLLAAVSALAFFDIVDS